MSITILAVADQVDRLLYDHFRPERWRHIDLLLSCGDLPPDYLDFLCSSLDVPVLYVRGNHDAAYGADRYAGCENVHGKIVTYRGLRIAGFQGCRRYNNGDLQYTEAEMRHIVWRTKLRALRTGPPHIVLAHAPPAGYHDSADPCHRGFECFTQLIHTWKPMCFMHGHVHAYERVEQVTQVGPTRVINPYPYRVIELPDPVPAPRAARSHRGKRSGRGIANRLPLLH
ncbi:MAG: metallophosphoesterase [Chloroflexi bacterium]|nr:metallophosphoesterase [Chloroflexota bacterium]